MYIRSTGRCAEVGVQADVPQVYREVYLSVKGGMSYMCMQMYLRCRI